MALVNLLSGFMQGFTQAQQAKQDQALKKQSLELQLKEMKLKDQQGALKQQMLMKLLGGGQLMGATGDESGMAPDPTQQAQPQSGGGLLDFLSDPSKLAALKIGADVDLSGIARVKAEQERPTIVKMMGPDGVERAYAVNLRQPDAPMREIGVTGMPKPERVEYEDAQGNKSSRWETPQYGGQITDENISQVVDQQMGQGAPPVTPQLQLGGKPVVFDQPFADLAAQQGMEPDEFSQFIQGIGEVPPGEPAQTAPTKDQVTTTQSGNVRLPGYTSVGDLEPYTFVGDDGLKYEAMRNKKNKEPVPDLKPIPVEPPPLPAAEVAGRLVMAMNGLRYIKEVEDMLLDPKTGKANRAVILSMNAPGGGIGEGRRLYPIFKDYADARVRISTGAAINAQEEEYYRSMYLPGMLDATTMSDAALTRLVKDKMKRAKEFLISYKSVMDPSGSINKRMDKALDKENSVPQRLEGESIQDYMKRVKGGE